MAWQLIAAAAAPYVAKGIGQALNKPKEEDFKPQTKYMEKYLSHLKGITTDREAQHLAMQPALRTIGAESRKTKQELGYQAEKAGITGSGIEAQMKLSAGQGTQQALAQASATAAANQAAINRRTGEQVAGVAAGIEQEKERAAEAFKQAKSQWKQENIQLGLEAASSLAGAGLKSSYQAGQAEAFTQSVQGFEGQAERMKELGMSPTLIAEEAKLYQGRMWNVAENLSKEGIPFNPYSQNLDDLINTPKFKQWQATQEGGAGAGEIAQDPSDIVSGMLPTGEKPQTPTVSFEDDPTLALEQDMPEIPIEQEPLTDIPEFGKLAAIPKTPTYLFRLYPDPLF